MIMIAGGLPRAHREEVRSNAEAALPPPDGALDDASLVTALKAGDEQAFRTLMDRHESAMLRLAHIHVGSHALAQDVVQETWLAVIRGIGRFRQDSSLKTWIFRILLNRARTWGRREARSLPFSEMETRTTNSRNGNGAVERILSDRGSAAQRRFARSPLHGVLDAELGKRIESAIETLSERQREILVLRYVEGWTSADACNALGISETNQRVLLHRARSRVRRALADYVEDQPREGDEHPT